MNRLPASLDTLRVPVRGHIFSHPHFAAHEAVAFAHDEPSGLRAIIAIHSSRMGPALGGCRIWPYSSEEEALSDVLRLSEGMTFKAAAAGLPFGGGKMVVIADPAVDKSPALLRAAGRAIDRLAGNYITGEDVGTTVGDMVAIAEATKHVMGLPKEMGGSGDPSPSTALGCFAGIKAAARHRLGRDDLKGLTVGIQGLGNVGWRLCRHLAEAGAQLLVSDVRRELTERAARTFRAQAVEPGAIHAVDADVFAPCALGNAVNRGSVAEIRARIVGGAANNQLEAPQLADELRGRGILYAPDFVINGGGMIQLASERAGWDSAELRRRLLGIGETLDEIFRSAEKQRISTLEAAAMLVELRLSGKPGDGAG